MELKISTQIHATELKEGVREAVENVFPSVEFVVRGDMILGSSEDRGSFAEFKEKLKKQQIRDTARSFLLERIDGEKLVFELNKQAAYMDKVNFVDFHMALGTIKVEIEDKDLEGLVEWLCS